MRATFKGTPLCVSEDPCVSVSTSGARTPITNSFKGGVRVYCSSGWWRSGQRTVPGAGAFCYLALLRRASRREASFQLGQPASLLQIDCS